MEIWKNISNSNYDVVRLSKFEVKQGFSSQVFVESWLIKYRIA